MTRTIRVDDEVYAWLQGQARPFEDTPNSVLRRISGLDTHRSEQIPLPTPSKDAGMPPSVQRRDPVKPARKFNEFDRERTIEAVEQHFHVKLSPIGSRRKFLRDDDNNPYLILGGKGDWHGVPNEIITDLQQNLRRGKLIIAKRSGMRTTIYCAPLKALLQHHDRMTINQEGDHQFNLAWDNGHPSIKEMPPVRFEIIAEIEYADEAEQK